MAQSHLPDAVVVVADQREVSELELQSLQAIVGSIPLICLHNSFSPGAAGSWNTGIHYIKKSYAGSYLAILDDDDAWLPEHLATCIACSDHGKADLVLSGIHVVKAGAIVATNIPKNICADDFLVGNPGWQGSNTFVAIDVITAVGGFTDGLISSNDRDLAIRLLSNWHQAINYTGIATVHWHCGHCDSALSAPGSAQKRLGCAQFLKLHGHRMSSQQKQQYFERMAQLFHLPAQDILSELHRIS